LIRPDNEQDCRKDQNDQAVVQRKVDDRVEHRRVL
jgi:hypothetical protein